RSPRALNPHIPRGLEAVCLKALAPQPGDRYPTALALTEEVEHWLADEPLSAWHATRGWRPARRRFPRTEDTTSARRPSGWCSCTRPGASPIRPPGGRPGSG